LDSSKKTWKEHTESTQTNDKQQEHPKKSTKDDTKSCTDGGGGMRHGNRLTRLNRISVRRLTDLLTKTSTLTTTMTASTDNST
jgi:hypothetical protein